MTRSGRRAGTCAAEGGGQRREMRSGGRVAVGVAHAVGGMGADGWRRGGGREAGGEWVGRGEEVGDMDRAACFFETDRGCVVWDG